MKIEKITLNHLRMPLKSAFETSFGRSVTRDCIIIGLYSEGFIGYGECVADYDPGYSYETCGTAMHILRDFIVPEIKGKNIQQPQDFPMLVAGIRGHQMAKAGVEMALWDLYGKMNNISLQDLFGGKEKRVKVGVSVGIQKSIPELIDTVQGYISSGYLRIKLKIKPGKDIEEVSAVREAWPEILLQVDANSAYTLDNASSLLPLDTFRLLLIEQPLDEDDIWDHRNLQKQFQTPICLDESIVSCRHARQAIEMEACRIINIKAGRVGGLTEALKIHDLCTRAGIPVWCGGMLETGVGRASNLALASLPGFILPGDISATERYYDEDITQETFVLNKDSTIDVPNNPGLGITVNPKAIKNFTVSQDSL